MMKYQIIRMVFTGLLLFVCTLTHAENMGKKVLEDVQGYIIPLVDIPVAELSAMNPEFRDYYNKNVRPDLLSLYMKTRVVFVDIRESGVQNEVLLIGDSARSSAWGMRNFAAIAAKNNDKWEVKAFKIIDGSIACPDSSDCHFAYYDLTIKPKTPNSFIGASLTYAGQGVSGNSFYIEIFGWNRYENSYYINTITSPIPLVPSTNNMFSR